MIEFMKKALCLVLCILFLMPLMASCSEEEAEYYECSFTAMDTVITLKLARDSGTKDENKEEYYFEDDYLSKICSDCADITAKIEKTISRTDEESIVSEINSSVDGIVNVDEVTLGLIADSFELTDKTNGAFDITLGTVTELWNIGGDTHNIPTEEEIATALSHTGKDKFEIKDDDIFKIDKEAKMDFGAIGKGYALGKVIEYLDTTDVVYGLVSFGGNIGTFGTKPENQISRGAKGAYKIAITNPLDKTVVSGYVYLDNGYVSVSGDYERYFEAEGVRYHHIFDPKTGAPSQSDIASVAVITDNGEYADALSTALFVMGSEEALSFYNSGAFTFEAVIITHDGTIITTNGITENELFEEFIPEETK